MAWNKGVLDLLEDPKKEFAEHTGAVLTGMSFAATVTGWRLVVKRVTAARVKEVAFIESWTIKECLEQFYDGVLMKPSSLVWKEDKF